MFSAMAIPACLWRRTGEIYKANREFAELVGVDNYMLREVWFPSFSFFSCGFLAYDGKPPGFGRVGCVFMS